MEHVQTNKLQTLKSQQPQQHLWPARRQMWQCIKNMTDKMWTCVNAQMVTSNEGVLMLSIWLNMNETKEFRLKKLFKSEWIVTMEQVKIQKHSSRLCKVKEWRSKLNQRLRLLKRLLFPLQLHDCPVNRSLLVHVQDVFCRKWRRPRAFLTVHWRNSAG